MGHHEGVTRQGSGTRLPIGKGMLRSVTLANPGRSSLMQLRGEKKEEKDARVT